MPGSKELLAVHRARKCLWYMGIASIHRKRLRSIVKILTFMRIVQIRAISEVSGTNIVAYGLISLFSTLRLLGSIAKCT